MPLRTLGTLPFSSSEVQSQMATRSPGVGGPLSGDWEHRRDSCDEPSRMTFMIG